MLKLILSDTTIVLYFLTGFTAVYFLFISIWHLIENRFKADPFYYYVVAMVIGLSMITWGAMAPRYYYLTGDYEMQMECIGGVLWALKNWVSFIAMVTISVHATYRFFFKKPLQKRGKNG